MKIIDYRFGSLSTETEMYDKDLIINRNKIYSNWWRKEGHKLHWLDIVTAIDEISPEILVVGQGKFGMMTVLPEVEQELIRRKIELIAAKTSKAVKEYNNLVEKKKVLGAFHLTC